jgi:uncharacterized protein (TIGR00255 family)
MVAQLCAMHQQVAQMPGVSQDPLRPMDVIRWPGAVWMAPADVAAWKPALLVGFEQAVAALQETRCREGEALGRGLHDRAGQILAGVVTLRREMPDLLTQQRLKLQTQVAALGITCDPSRLEQETLLLVQRSDVMEELERLEVHAREVQRQLALGGCVGRRLDFLMQELHREANTLSAKALTPGITQLAVDLKVGIEQMREQVQNLE